MMDRGFWGGMSGVLRGQETDMPSNLFLPCGVSDHKHGGCIVLLTKCSSVRS